MSTQQPEGSLRELTEALNVADLTALVSTFRDLAAEVHLPRLLSRILAEATRLTDSPDGSVLLLDEKRSCLYFAHAVGDAAPMLLAEWGRSGAKGVPLVGSKAGQVYTSMTSVTVDAIPEDPNHFEGVDRDTKRRTECMVCVPLVAAIQASGEARALGVIQILNKRGGNYTVRDRIVLERFGELAAVAIQNAQLVSELYANKGLYAGDDVDPRELLERPAWSELLSVLIVDMRGFTQLCQLIQRPERTQALLNRFLSMLADAVLDQRGVVNKFLGDGLMAFFRGPAHEARAVDSALRMLREFDVMKAEWVESHNVSLSFIDIGIGISTEEVILGAVGGEHVWDFTAIGTGVNLAAHLMEHARNGRRILVDKVTFRKVRDRKLRSEGPEKFDLAKPGQTVAHPYERYVLYSDDDKAQAPAERDAPTRQAGRLFISYSSLDDHWRQRLRTHLQPFVTSGIVEIWDDTQIEAGKLWKEAIDKALSEVSVAIFLVSPNLLASQFAIHEEFAPILQRARARKVSLLWLPVSASSYEQTEFKDIQAAHNPKKPLDQMSEPQQNGALVEVCKIIKSALTPATSG